MGDETFDWQKEFGGSGVGTASDSINRATVRAMSGLYGFVPETDESGDVDWESWEAQAIAHDEKTLNEIATKKTNAIVKRIHELVPSDQIPNSTSTDSSKSPLEGGLRGVLCTKMGTPCSPKWDEDWIALLERTEEEVGHRCCGAHAPDEAPCQLESKSKNGRCRFHGGGLNSGAQKGNSNARIHGLYARRIQQCGEQCPQWKTCPYAGEDVAKLPEMNRPNCYFEEEELQALRMLDATAHEVYKPLVDRELEDLQKAPYPMYAQLLSLRENLNMLQIMITRAAKALSTKGFTSETVQQTDKYFVSHEKPSALLQAHQMLTREHRLTLGTYERFVSRWGMPKFERVGNDF